MTTFHSTQYDILAPTLNLSDLDPEMIQKIVIIKRGNSGVPILFSKRPGYEHLRGFKIPTGLTTIFQSFVADLSKAKLYKELGETLDIGRVLQKSYLSYICKELYLTTKSNIFSWDTETKTSGVIKRVPEKLLLIKMRDRFLNLGRIYETAQWKNTPTHDFHFSQFDPGNDVKVLHRGNIVFCKFLHDSIIDPGYCYIKMLNCGHGNVIGKFHITCVHPVTALEPPEPSVSVQTPPTTVLDPSMSTVPVAQTNATIITATTIQTTSATLTNATVITAPTIETTSATVNQSDVDVVDDAIPITRDGQTNFRFRDRVRPQYFSESTHSTRGMFTGDDNDYFSNDSDISDDDSEAPSEDYDGMHQDELLQRFGRGNENYSKISKAEWEIRPLVKITFRCPICLVDFVNHETKQLTKCPHHICMDCSLEAIELLHECPFCRKRMVDYYETSDEE